MLDNFNSKLRSKLALVMQHAFHYVALHFVTPIAVYINKYFSFFIQLYASASHYRTSRELVRIRVKMCRVNHSVHTTPITVGKKIATNYFRHSSFSLQAVDPRSVACLLHNPVMSFLLPHCVRRHPFHPSDSHVQSHRCTCHTVRARHNADVWRTRWRSTIVWKRGITYWVIYTFMSPIFTVKKFPWYLCNFYTTTSSLTAAVYIKSDIYPYISVYNLIFNLQRFYWHLLSANRGRYVPLYFSIC